jgi:hypothetical protein
LAKQKSVQKKLREFGRQMKARQAAKATDQSPSSKPDRSSLEKRLAPKIARAANRACKTLGVALESDRDWKLLMLILLLAVFGGPGPGQPKRWSKKKLRRLRHAVDEIRKEKDPEPTEKECCEILIKGKADHGRYDDLKATTLVRVLQNAKNLDEDNQLLTVSEVQQLRRRLV